MSAQTAQFARKTRPDFELIDVFTTRVLDLSVCRDLGNIDFRRTYRLFGLL